MAATFTQLSKIATDSGFMLRVKLGMLSTALAVYNEASTTPGHPARAAFATKALLNQGYDLQTVALMVSDSAAIIAVANASTLPDFGITDQNILDAISAAWNAMAGA
jgi:hypothetical protein